LKRIIVALVLSVALGFVGLYVAAGEALFEAETYRIKNPSAPVIAVCVVAFLAEWLTPAIRIRMLCRAQNIVVPYRSALLVHLLSVLGAIVTPNNSGQGPVLVAALNRLGVPLGAGIGVVMQIFVLDLVFYAWVVPLSLWYLLYSDVVVLPASVEVFALAVAALVAIGAVFLGRYPRLIVSLLLAAAKWRPLERFGNRLRKVARDYHRSSRAYLSAPGSTWLALHAVTPIGWLAASVLLWGLLQLYGIDVDLLATLALLSSISLVSQFVPTPGGGAGFVEAAVGLSVGYYATGGSVAAALIVWRLAALYLVFLVGPLAGWLLLLSPPVKRIRRGPVQPADADEKGIPDGRGQ